MSELSANEEESISEEEIRLMLELAKSTGDKSFEFKLYCVLAFQYSDSLAYYEVADMIRKGNIFQSPELKRKESISCMKKSADLGYPKAMLEYSRMVYSTNREESKKYLFMAIKQNNLEAMIEQSNRLYNMGKNDEGFNFLRLAAERGSVDAARDAFIILFEKSKHLNKGENPKELRRLSKIYYDMAVRNGYSGDEMDFNGLEKHQNTVEEENELRNEIKMECNKNEREIVISPEFATKVCTVVENAETLRREAISAIRELSSNFEENLYIYRKELSEIEKIIDEGVLEAVAGIKEEKAKKERIYKFMDISLAYKKLAEAGNEEALENYKRLSKEITKLVLDKGEVIPLNK